MAITQTEIEALDEMNWTKDLILFSIDEMYLDENGKKQTKHDFQGWTKLTKSKVNDKHKVKCLLCGEASGVTIVDFDCFDDYDKLVEKGIFENYNKYPTVITRRGFHVYFKYDKTIIQPKKESLNIDILNDKKRAYYPGTTYPINETESFTYCWEFSGELQEIPTKLKDYINSLSKPTKETKQVKEKVIENKNDKTDQDLNMKIVELISPEYLNNREDWLKIVFAMKREGFSQEDALRISNKATDCRSLTDSAWNETWNSEDNRDTGVSMGTLKYYAKLSQPLEYSLLFKENFLLDKITERSLASLFDALAGQNIVYCEEEKEFYCWYKSKCRIEDKEGSFIRTLLSQTLTEYFDKLIFNVRRDLNNCEGDDTSLKTKYEKLKEILKTVERTTWLNNIWKELQSIVKCKCEKLEFDTNPDLIAFNNKKYNFRTKEWSDIKYDDFVSMNTGKDWKEPTKEQLDCISKLFEEIFPNPEIRKSYLSILYNACIGGKKDKFVIANGKGGNGKGLINELVKVLLGDYAYEAHVSLLTREFRGGANPELANVHKKRFVLFKEPDATEKLFLGNVKTLVDNDSVNARQLYKGKCEITLNAIVCMETNVRLKFSGKPTEAETRRFMDILFESTFTENDDMLHDKTLKNVYPMKKQYVTKEFQNEHRCALFQYIIDNAEKQIYNPKCVVERTKCYIEGEDTFANWYKENYDITGDKDDILKIKDMFEDYKESDDYKNMRKDERPNLHRFLHQYVLTDNKLSARYTERYKYFIGENRKESRSVLVGIKLKNVDDNDD